MASKSQIKLAKKAILIKRGELSPRYGELYKTMADSHTEEELLAIIAEDPEYVAPVEQIVESVIEKPVVQKPKKKRKKRKVTK
jgi:hypothetical protein